MTHVRRLIDWHQTKTLKLNARRIASHLQATFRFVSGCQKHDLHLPTVPSPSNVLRLPRTGTGLTEVARYSFHAAFGAGFQAHPAEPLQVLLALL